jgi:hypothetical protein
VIKLFLINTAKKVFVSHVICSCLRHGVGVSYRLALAASLSSGAVGRVVLVQIVAHQTLKERTVIYTIQIW